MFILRRITSESKEVNTVIGKTYNVIYPDRNKEDFEETLKIMHWEEKPEDVYAFIIYDNGSTILALYKKSTYFMMCSDGKTFANLTYKFAS